MCGAELKEQRKRRFRLPEGEMVAPLFIIAAIVVLWLWKPWQTQEPEAMAPTTATVSVTVTATALPTATYMVMPSATPLHSPTPPPTVTLPPDQTRHVIESGETVITIAKLYGTTKDAIFKANDLNERSILSVGDELIIPLPVANTSTPTPTPTPSPTPFEYLVRTADTLSAIAKKYNTTVEALMEANGITDATRLRVGTSIRIVQPPDYSATMAYEIYRVKPGDTLISISARHNMSVAEIKEANDLTSNNLSIDQELRIPVGTATPSPTPTYTPTLTPTPGPPHPAPALLGPPDDALFDGGADEVIVLNWASVGILDEEQWYVVHLRRVATSLPHPQPFWTKATSWRLPADILAEGSGASQQFRWWVTVMQQTGVDEDGIWTGEKASPQSDTRVFFWR